MYNASQKILLIEDEVGIQNFLREGLEEEGYFISAASNGSEGLALFENDTFDLILLDWMLPGQNGLQVCTKIRQKNKVIPILFLTAKDTIQETVEGLKAGANDYIKKPFSFEELLLRIKVHLKTTKDLPRMELGNIVMNKDTYQVFVDKKEVVLTTREFELLRYLMVNKGKVCTRKKIIEDVWDIHFEYDSGVIDVFINAIRKKLNFTKENELIKSVRGIGYIAND